MIAGGIGITPLKSMIECATDLQLATPMTLIYSNRTPHDVTFKDELDAIEERNPNLDTIYTITRPESHHAWTRRTGRIDENLLRDVSSHKPNARFYICGTPNMVHDTIQLLLALGVPPEHILQEQFRGYARHMEVAA